MRISVIVASYNYARYLPEVLETALGQTHADLELVAVDDGSSDDSWRILGEYAKADSRMRVLRHEDAQNHGLAATLQLGLSHAHGEYVAFLESDDAWEKDCLEKRARRVQASGADLVYNHCSVVGDMSQRRPRMQRRMVETCRTAALSRGPLFHLDSALLYSNLIPTFSCVMLKKELLAGLDFHPPVPAWLDYWLWLQIGTRARCAFIGEPLTRWRVHPESYNAQSPSAKCARFLRFSAALHPFLPQYGVSVPRFWTSRIRRKSAFYLKALLQELLPPRQTILSR